MTTTQLHYPPQTGELLAYKDIEYLEDTTGLLAYSMQVGTCALYGAINRLTSEKLVEEISWISQHNYGKTAIVIDCSEPQHNALASNMYFENIRLRTTTYGSNGLVVLHDIDRLIQNPQDTAVEATQRKAAQNIVDFLMRTNLSYVCAVSRSPHPAEVPQVDTNFWKQYFTGSIALRGSIQSATMPLEQKLIGVSD